MIVAVSDTHLGTEHLDSVDPDREAFKRFLRYLETDLQPTHLVLNGDIEDFWRRDMRTLTRENYDVFGQLRDLQAAGTAVHYVLGNHDWYARKDVAVHRRPDDDGAESDRYYDSGYPDRLTISTHGTSYTFMHGHQFDPLQDEWYFDKLAVISTDSLGATFSEKWALFSEVDGPTGVVRALAKLASDRMRLGTWESRLGKMDRCGDHDPDVSPRAAERYAAAHPDTDWLCIGHTHCAGIEADANVANSGAWLDGRDTYLVLTDRPRLMAWNDGDPKRIAGEPGRSALGAAFRRLTALGDG